MASLEDILKHFTELTVKPSVKKVIIVIKPGKITLDKVIACAILQKVFRKHTKFIFSELFEDIKRADIVLETGGNFSSSNGLFDSKDNTKLSYDIINYFSDDLLKRYTKNTSNIKEWAFYYFLIENIVFPERSIFKEFLQRKERFEEIYKSYNLLYIPSNDSFTNAVNIYVHELDYQIEKFIYHCNLHLSNFASKVNNNFNKPAKKKSSPFINNNDSSFFGEKQYNNTSIFGEKSFFNYKNYLLITEEEYLMFANQTISKISDKMDFLIIQYNNSYTVRFLSNKKFDENNKNIEKISEKDVLFISDDKKTIKVEKLETAYTLINIK